MLKEVLIFVIALFVLVKSGQYAVTAVKKLARHFRMTEFVTSFLLVAFVASLPEAIIAIVSAFGGDPSIGLGTLLGANIADLTLILGLVALAGKKVRIRSSIIKKDFYFVGLLLLPILLGFNGVISRLDGAILLTAGVAFCFILMKERQYFRKQVTDRVAAVKQVFILLTCIAFILISAYFIVESAHTIAIGIGVPSIIIGLVLVALGTTLPEFSFSLQSIRKGHVDLAIGDLLGSVVVDATILIGIIALIAPIPINTFIWAIIGVFTMFAVIFSLLFMRTDNMITKNEAYALIFFYIAFIVVLVLLR